MKIFKKDFIFRLQYGNMYDARQNHKNLYGTKSKKMSLNI